MAFSNRNLLVVQEPLGLQTEVNVPAGTPRDCGFLQSHQGGRAHIPLPPERLVPLESMGGMRLLELRGSHHHHGIHHHTDAPAVL